MNRKMENGAGKGNGKKKAQNEKKGTKERDE